MYLTTTAQREREKNAHLIYQLAFYFILEIDVREVKW